MFWYRWYEVCCGQMQREHDQSMTLAKAQAEVVVCKQNIRNGQAHDFLSQFFLAKEFFCSVQLFNPLLGSGKSEKSISNYTGSDRNLVGFQAAHPRHASSSVWRSLGTLIFVKPIAISCCYGAARHPSLMFTCGELLSNGHLNRLDWLELCACNIVSNLQTFWSCCSA